MEHFTMITDADPYFEIDVNTRAIINKSSTKTAVMQYDHNSERFTFSLPRFIENHDMTECDVIAVHYLNVSLTTKETISGIYEIKDITIDPTDESKVICTWLLSRNVTNQAGALSFILRFQCNDADGNITYSWSTDTFKGIAVTAGINNTDEIYTEYADVLNQWKLEIDNDIKIINGDGQYSIVTKNTNARAIGDFSAAIGLYTFAGFMGCYYKAVDFTNKKIYLTLTQQHPVRLATGYDESAYIEDDYPTPAWEIGDDLSILNYYDYHFSGVKIVAIEKNVITCEGDLPSSMTTNRNDSIGRPYRYSVAVPTKPDVGNHSMTTSGFSEGRNTKALGRFSHAEGYGTITPGNYGHAEGNQTIAGASAHSEGQGTKALGHQSHTEGLGTLVTVANGHAEGTNTEVAAEAGHAEGDSTKVLEDYGHAEGLRCKTTGQAGHAEGIDTQANGHFSHSEGWGSKADGKTSHAEGRETVAGSPNSHTEGCGTIASADNQHVQGRYNIKSDKYIHIVGNGSSDSKRSNAHTLDLYGNAWYQGTVETTGVILKSPNGTRYKLTVADDGTLTTTAV